MVVVMKLHVTGKIDNDRTSISLKSLNFELLLKLHVEILRKRFWNFFLLFYFDSHSLK